MRIDKQNLIDLLVEKTNMGRDEIKAQLDQLIERILDAAKRGKALEIKEFGVFYFDEEGELSFDASDELSTEISFKYAGMKPVELNPERNTAITDQVEEETLEEEETLKEEETEDQFDDFFAEESDTKKADEEEEEDVFDDSLYDPFAPEAMEPLGEPPREESKTTIEDIKPVSSRRPIKKKKDYTGIFILIGIIVVAVIIGGYFYYIGTQTQELDDRAEATAQTDAQLRDEQTTETEDLTTTDSENGDLTETDQETDETSATTEPQGTNEVSEEEIVSDTGVPISQTDQPLYGLTGTVVEEANIGYSIVLHSFTSEDRAISTADRLRNDGYRVIVTSRTVYENMVWRVSVGQFETLGDAQQNTTRLPNPYNTQNFIQRIRTN